MHPLIVIHRGISDHRSVAAAQAQLGDVASFVEVDLDVSKDGVVFVLHDPRVGLFVFREPYLFKKRGVKKKAHQLLFSEIQELFPNVITFSELITKIPPSQLLCELKSYTAYKGVIHILHRMHPEAFHAVRFISFSMRALAEVKSIDPRIYCSYIATSAGDDKRFHFTVRRRHIQECVARGIEEISGHWLAFRPNAITAAHQAGLKVGMGQLNTRRAVRYAEKNGVDVWYTDNAEYVRKHAV